MDKEWDIDVMQNVDHRSHTNPLSLISEGSSNIKLHKPVESIQTRNVFEGGRGRLYSVCRDPRVKETRVRNENSIQVQLRVFVNGDLQLGAVTLSAEICER